jgi:ribonuclease HI
LRTKSEFRAELAGIVAGLRKLKNPGWVLISTRNSYLKDEMVRVLRCVRQTVRLMKEYPVDGRFWRPDKNSDLWEEFGELAKGFAISVKLTSSKHDEDYKRAQSAAHAGSFAGHGERLIENAGFRWKQVA